ncbi:MAG: SIMPL domain-containing protein [Piscinibacter sp.]|uniref:SIMPL domain-containing protein n=1 Tax=Piscinibacter sp. TaxID=1903157 RepID=UPI00258B7722|nr:SIMPL domain-containing protein [Piscinibacter sp.]MCW5663619.1 SIMPL domain-containing protein [Piscinibacter sp.]
MKKSLLRSSLLLAAIAGPAFAQADTPPPQGVVALSASASVDVTKDLLNVTFSTTREGADAAAVQSQLKQALDAALAEAKKVAKPGQLEVQTGNFSLYPRYAPKGGISGWQGSAELIVEGRDMPAIGALTGRITTLSIARVGYGLSRELREKVEGDVAAQAIARFRAKAADYTKQFGYGSYTVREVNVNADSPVMLATAPTLRAKAMSAPSDESLPVEAGKGTVTVNVNGTVQMK